MSHHMQSLINDLSDDRKKFNRSIDQFDTETCKHCGGPMEQSIAADPGSDNVEYYSACKNPDCPSNNQ